MIVYLANASGSKAHVSSSEWRVVRYPEVGFIECGYLGGLLLISKNRMMLGDG